MMIAYWHNPASHASVSRKELSHRRSRIHSGFRTDDVSSFAVLRVGWRSLDIPTHAEVQRQPRQHFEIILPKKGSEPAIRKSTNRCVLGDGIGNAQKKIRQGIA